MLAMYGASIGRTGITGLEVVFAWNTSLGAAWAPPDGSWRLGREHRRPRFNRAPLR